MKEITVSKEFVDQADELLSKIGKDSFIVTRFQREFNKDNEYIKESLGLCIYAREAEEKYQKETKEAEEAKAAFAKKFKTASFNFTKHISFLKLLLKYDIKNQIELGIIHLEGTRSKEDWFEQAITVYERVINAPYALSLLKTFNIQLSDFLEGLQAIVLARDANVALVKESTEVRTAIFNKDVAFNALYYRMQIIQLCCYYSLQETPEKFAELGLPIINNEIGIMIKTVKDSSVKKDIVKDSSITKMKKKPTTKKEK
jgi:hypothetical protein